MRKTGNETKSLYLSNLVPSGSLGFLFFPKTFVLLVVVYIAMSLKCGRFLGWLPGSAENIQIEQCCRKLGKLVL